MLRRLTLLSCLFVLLAPAKARANGRFPASNAITFDPSDPSRVYLRATFGLLVSSDAGRTWDWVCERSLGFSGPEDPTIGVFADGTVAAALFEGLSVSHDRACSFAFQEGALDKKVFVDVSVRKSDGKTGVAITSGYANRNDDAGNALFSSEVFVTKDAGKTWERRGQPLDPSLLLQTVDVSPVVPDRIFISGIRGSMPDVSGVLLRSDDGGLTFTERAIPLARSAAGDLGPRRTERAPFIAALDPKDADILWVRVLGTVDQGARLLFTKDAGKTWKTAFTTTGPMKGFALSDDGETIFAGSPKDGVWAATKTDVTNAARETPFVKASDLPVACLAFQKGELWACSNEAAGFIGGVSTDRGKTWQARAHLGDLRGPLTCPAGTRTAELCRADWPQQRAVIGIERPTTTADAGEPSPAVSTPKPESRCACDQAGAPAGKRWSAGLLLLAAAAFVARRRRWILADGDRLGSG